MSKRTAAEKTKIVDLVMNKGIPTNCVAERFSCSVRAVGNVLRSSGYEFNPSDKTWRRADSSKVFK